MTTHRIIFGNYHEVLPELEADSVHLVVTSPRYNAGKDYGAVSDDTTWEQWFEEMDALVSSCRRVLRPCAKACFVLPSGIKGRPTAYDFADILRRHFFLKATIDWFKRHEPRGTQWGSWCSPANPAIRAVHEVILIGQNGEGSLSWGGKTDITAAEFTRWTTSLWQIPRGNCTDLAQHPAPFPTEIPLRLMKLFCYPGDTVLDPCLGSGTTTLAGRQSGRDTIGVELNTDYEPVIRQRLGLGQPQLPGTDEDVVTFEHHSTAKELPR